MHHEHSLRVVRSLALLSFSLGACHRAAEAQAQAQDPPRPSHCPAAEPEANAACATPGRASCEYYSGPPQRRSLRARCTCERAEASSSPRWSCQSYASRGPLPPPELEA